jgi:hypothetical protein
VVAIQTSGDWLLVVTPAYPPLALPVRYARDGFEGAHGNVLRAGLCKRLEGGDGHLGVGVAFWSVWAGVVPEAVKIVAIMIVEIRIINSSPKAVEDRKAVPN